ncbi:MAG: molybdopterin-synthase adenylyltransferase MoeB [Chloroherpetonaceae bacterium]|nr:molybdopterin-synthase adenylyltransferase MoeB [Chloroherpetonaceae bacterium]MCS7211034.1 molybdopterin-synthase adenylyltransferase MoeB [Chloroherpetonaceae bacterium]
MPAKIIIPTALRQYADGKDTVEVSASSVGDALAQLSQRYPALRKNLYTEDGKLRTFINIYKGDENIRNLQNLDTALSDGDELMIVPSIAGGALFGEMEVESSVELSNEEIKRYARHLIIPEFGMAGQKKLKQARVLMIGAGGLGSPFAMYMAAAGIGHLGIVDYDVVDFSNLQRQLLHGTPDVGRPKTLSAKETIQRLNPNVEVTLYDTPLTSANALEIFKDYDVIVDGTDNFPTRYLVNDACVMLGKPNVYGSIFRFEGQVSVFWANSHEATNGRLPEGACYRCLYPEPPPPGLVPSCAEGGVLGVLPGVVGTLQAIETIKLITGMGEPLINRLLLFDALKMKFRELKLRKNPDCAVCSDHPTVTKLIDYEQFCGMPAHDRQGNAEASASSSTPKVSSNPNEITVFELKARLDAGERPFLLDVRNPNEWDIVRLHTATLIPLPELPNRLHELAGKEDTEILVYCKMGGRSAQACEILRKNGFKKVRNVVGGITAWAKEIDPSMPTY